MMMWLLKSLQVMFVITSLALASGVTLSVMARLMTPGLGEQATGQ